MKEGVRSGNFGVRFDNCSVSPRAVGAMKKGVSGKPKVFEPKKEKKRRLILNDSESDEDLGGSICQRVDVSADQNAAGNVDLTKSSVDYLKPKEESETDRETVRLDPVKNSECGRTDRKRNREDEEIDSNKNKMDSLKHREEKTEIKGSSRVLRPKLVALTAQKNEGGETECRKISANNKRTLLNSHGNGSSVVKRIRAADLLEQKRPRFEKGRQCILDGATGENVSISSDKGIRIQGKSGVSKLISENKRVLGGSEKKLIRRKAEEDRKGSASTSISSRIILRRQALSEEKKLLEKSSLSGKTLKNHVNSKDKVCDIKQEDVNVSLQMGSQKKERGRRKSNSISKNIQSSKPNCARNTERQLLRDRLKNILLSAGWKIIFVQRRSRDYKDSVYYSPDGGSYWSIVKAYGVFQKQLNCRDKADGCLSLDNPKDKELPGKLPETSADSNHQLDGTSSPISTIPMEELSILMRRTSKKIKRERAQELEEERRNKKGKSLKGKFKEDSFVSLKTKGLFQNLKSNHLSGKQKGHLRKGKINSKQKGCALLVRSCSKGLDPDTDNFVPYAGKRTVLSWLIDSGTVVMNRTVKYMDKRQTRSLMDGQIKRDGICCSCCSKIFTVSEFEIHAGSKLCQPFESLFQETGISLLQCQLDAWDKQKDSRTFGFHLVDIDGDDPNDDTCGICGDGGDLICCDGCPSTFHQSCLDIQILPPGDWHCPNCSCKFCGVAGDTTAKGDNLNVSPLVSCRQCEKKYHQGCIRETDLLPGDSDRLCASFCGKHCREIFEQLQKLLGLKNELEMGFSWTLIRRFDEEDEDSKCFGLPKRAECNSKLAIAETVMDECFMPIIDQRSTINLIQNVLYNCGSNFNRLNYSGFYTVILERGDEIISAASIRIHGMRLAEMPFIGTRHIYRRQGMCRRLLNAIESALCSLNVQKLVIPAISELIHTWTVMFGFKPLEELYRQEIKSMNLLMFPGTGLLQKILQTGDFNEGNAATGTGIKDVKLESNHYDTPEVENKYLVVSAGSDHCASEAGVVEMKDVVSVEVGFSSHGGSLDCAPASDFYHGSNFQASCVVTEAAGFSSPGGSLDCAPEMPSTSDVHHGSNFQASSVVSECYDSESQYKSPESAPDKAVPLHSDVGFDNEAEMENKCLMVSPVESNLRSDEGTVHDDKVKAEEGVENDFQSLGEASIDHTSDTVNEYSDALSGSNFQPSGGNSLHCNSRWLDKTAEPPSDAYVLVSDVTHHDSPEVTNISIITSPVWSHRQECGADVVHDSHELRTEGADLPKSNLHGSEYSNSKITTQTPDATSAYNFHVLSEGTVCHESEITMPPRGVLHDNYEIKDEVDVVEHDNHALCEDCINLASEVTRESLDAASESNSLASGEVKNSELLCKSCDSEVEGKNYELHDSDIALVTTTQNEV